jgi:hypothetical protein
MVGTVVEFVSAVWLVLSRCSALEWQPRHTPFVPPDATKSVFVASLAFAGVVVPYWSRRFAPRLTTPTDVVAAGLNRL